MTWGKELAAMLETIHSKGYVYVDLKSSNVVVTPDEQLRLVDFELTCEQSCSTSPYGHGTRGYSSPQLATGQIPTIADDIYALGALLYFMATGAEPSVAPYQSGLLARPPRLMNPSLDPVVERVIICCIDRFPAKRFPSASAIRNALSTACHQTSVTPPAFGQELAVPEVNERQGRYQQMAKRLADSLCNAAHVTPDGQGLTWTSTHRINRQVPLPSLNLDLNSGTAGSLLALAEVAGRFGDERHYNVLCSGARWLARHNDPNSLPGLYVGESGIGAALLRAGQMLGDQALITEATRRGQRISSMPFRSPDLFNGTAGRARFHLLVWDETGDQPNLHAARQAGESLLVTAEDAGGETLRWRIPAGYERLSGSCYLGYAHGAAGIGDVLLDVFEATGEDQFLGAARNAARWLTQHVIPVMDDETGMNWPLLEKGQEPAGAFWCHGATGIGRFLLHAARLEVLPEATELAALAAHTAARGARWAGPTQCHGLAGNIEFLLDMYQATGDKSYLSEAFSLAALLEAFGVERDGWLMWPSESATTFTPDYMIGYAGIILCLLCLSKPEEIPHQLSREGFSSPDRMPLR